MELNNGQVKLTRRERMALGIRDKTVAAHEIGRLWSTAIGNAGDRINGINDRDARALMGMAAARAIAMTDQAVYRDWETLLAMTQEVTGIDTETFAPGAEPPEIDGGYGEDI